MNDNDVSTRYDKHGVTNDKTGQGSLSLSTRDQGAISLALEMTQSVPS